MPTMGKDLSLNPLLKRDVDLFFVLSFSDLGGVIFFALVFFVEGAFFTVFFLMGREALAGVFFYLRGSLFQALFFCRHNFSQGMEYYLY
jgi:hypothetical protein